MTAFFGGWGTNDQGNIYPRGKCPTSDLQRARSPRTRFVVLGRVELPKLNCELRASAARCAAWRGELPKLDCIGAEERRAAVLAARWVGVSAVFRRQFPALRSTTRMIMCDRHRPTQFRTFVPPPGICPLIPVLPPHKTTIASIFPSDLTLILTLTRTPTPKT